jgi:signal transduction histidine kinase
MPSGVSERSRKPAGLSRFRVVLGVAVVVATLLGLGRQFVDQRHTEMDAALARSRSAAYDLDQMIRRFADHAEILRAALEADLDSPRTQSARWNQVTRLQPSRYFSGFALDDVPPERQAEVGNITGTAELDITDSGLTHELSSAFAIHPLFRLVKRNIAVAPWVYYTSKRGFISAYPWLPSSEHHYMPNFLTKEFFLAGTPEANPRRRSFWTAPYTDLFGTGAMVTVGTPVYWRNAFMGVIGIDLRLDTLADFLDERATDGGEASLASLQGRRIVGAALPDAAVLRSLTDGEPASVNGVVTIVHRLETAPWMTVTRISEMAVSLRTLARMKTELLVTGLVILCVGFLVGQYFTMRALVAKKEQLESVMEELVKARDEAQAANRAKSAFLANIGHEIRTPLNAIIGFADLIPLMSDGAPKQPVLAEYATYIKDAGDHLLKVLNDLLDLAKAEANRIELNEAPLELSRLVQHCLRMVAPQAEKGRLMLTTRVPADLPPIHADDMRLRQILINLLSNAIKFTPEGGSVEVSAEPTDTGGVRIAVRDTGIGIAPNDIAKALEPFGQIDNALSRKHRGTGLGLALTRRLTELHGGNLAIASEVGTGTTVSVTLPADRVLHPAAA